MRRLILTACGNGATVSRKVLTYCFKPMAFARVAVDAGFSLPPMRLPSFRRLSERREAKLELIMTTIHAVNGEAVAIIPGPSWSGNARVKGGKMEKPDALSWTWHSASDYTLLNIGGLYRISGFRWKVKAADLYAALLVEHAEQAMALFRAYQANGIESLLVGTTLPAS